MSYYYINTSIYDTHNNIISYRNTIILLYLGHGVLIGLKLETQNGNTCIFAKFIYAVMITADNR